MIVVGSVAVLLLVLTSPPPETLALLVTMPGALLATFTVNVMGGYEEWAESASLRVQVSVPSVHDHPVPLMAVAVSPVGTVSVTVTVLPSVCLAPMLVTVSVYVS